MATVRRGRKAATGFLRDFQEFALKGSVMDLAVGIVIGAAFGKIVESFTNDVLMALINPLLTQMGGDWQKLMFGPIALGKFLAAILNFLIIAFAIYLVIRAIAKFKRQEAAAEEAEAPPDPVLESQARLTEAIDKLTERLDSQRSGE
jgi:large conductance mechanosensitive channel